MAILINCTPKSSLEMPRVEEVKARRQRLAADFPDRLTSTSAFQINDCGSITCDNCKIKSTKVCYCVGCKMFMCPSCLAAHEILQVTFEGHSHISSGDPTRTLRGLVGARKFLLGELPLAVNNKLFLPELSVLHLPLLRRDDTPGT